MKIINRTGGCNPVLHLFVLFLLSTIVNAMPSDQQIAQFKADYAIKKDAWLSDKTEQTSSCLNGLINQLDKCRHEPYSEMLLYSVHGLGDLGDQPRCLDINLNTTYVVMTFNISTTPVNFRQGLCMPKYCSQGMYNDFSTKVTNKLTTALQGAISKFGIETYVLPPDVGVTLSFTDTATIYDVDEYNLAVQAQDGDGVYDDVPGINVPQTSVALFWIILILLSIWLLAIIVISIVYFKENRKFRANSSVRQSILNNSNSLKNTLNDQIPYVTQQAAQQPLTFAHAKSNKELFTRILSMQYSIAQLSKPRKTSPKYDDLRILDGLRVLCLLWVILLGSAQFTMSSAVYNPWTLQQYFLTYGYTAVYSSNLGFDEFFFFSSLLMTLKIMDLIQENTLNSQQGKMNVTMYLKMLLLRFIRLAPIYYFVFLVGWQLGPYFGDGPCWFTYEKGFSNCNDYWWSVFTMTINFFPSYVIANEGCFYWGWYPACEMQLMLITPWIAYFIIKVEKRWLQATLVSLGVLVSIGVNYYIIYNNGLAAALFAPQDILIFKEFLNKPYSKLHAIFLGIGMAIIYDSIQRQKARQDGTGLWNKLAKSKLFAWGAYILAVIMILFVTLYPFKANAHPTKWSQTHNCVFISLSRPAFILSIMTLIICMSLNHGRMLKGFFSLSFWVPLSRLSYIVYLIFPIANATLISSMNQSMYLTYMTMFALIFFSYTLCMLVAFLAHITVEGPMMNLIMNSQIRAKESEDRLQRNLKMLDYTVRKTDEMKLKD